MKLTWKEVLDTKQYPILIDYYRAKELAINVGYKYFAFNDMIYSVDDNEFKSIGLVEDLNNNILEIKDSSKNEEYTKDEAIQIFLEHIHNLIDYWENLDNKTIKERLEGLAFSILNTLDGGASDLPSYELKPISNEEDIEYLKSNGEKYYPLDSYDIAGNLHEIFLHHKK